MHQPIALIHINILKQLIQRKVAINIDMADEQKARPKENEIPGGLLHPQFTHPISREKI